MSGTYVLLSSSRRPWVIISIAILAVLHLVVATSIMIWSEHDLVSGAAFLLFWGVLNFLWLMVVRRPAPAAALSLIMIAILILLSQFKHRNLAMTVTFDDVMVVDPDTVTFLTSVFPNLRWEAGIAAIAAAAAFGLIWWLDVIHIRWRVAFLGFVTCFGGLAALSFAIPLDRGDDFLAKNFVSKFARSGIVATVDLATRGVLESDARVVERLTSAEDSECHPTARLPNIVLILDESSFDATMMAGVKVPADYQRRFLSLDGKKRTLVVEGAGGPTWFTEYNVLSGLSVRSYGRFAQGVTRLAAGRVTRGLPYALRRCGYQTFSIYPYFGAFLSARSYQTTTGIERFLDMKDLGAPALRAYARPDSFYYDYASRLFLWEKRTQPLFLLVYTSANHGPWTYTFNPSQLPDWRNLGNRVVVDEYLRRQEMSARDYAKFVASLKEDFPDEPFLLIRFGDHQPLFAKTLIDPTLGEAEIGRRIDTFDPRYFATYYAIDAINFQPADMSSALDTLDAPYLPLVVLEAAGVPLAPSFAEQKKILDRCRGLFYLCGNGAEARRFNRILIDAGLINGL